MISDNLLDFEHEHKKIQEEIRKETLDVYNRLHSIHEDITFVQRVHEAYPSLPMIPNLRCGAWYVDPEVAHTTFAYFKSTDGHYNNWSFNLRRPNLHLLRVICERKGIILVDSTRSGKKFPDALAKTVPIWCEVVNRAVRIRFPGSLRGLESVLYTPASSVSPQEMHSIASKLDDWARSLAASSYELPLLNLPLRPFWISPSTSVFPSLPDPATSLPVLCVCASRQVEQGLDRRSAGYVYVQGSADDHELWGMGLSPDVFWRHKQELLSVPRQHLNDKILSLVCQYRTTIATSEAAFSPTPITFIRGHIRICRLEEIPSPLPHHLVDEDITGSQQQVQASYVVVKPDATPQLAAIETPSSPAILTTTLEEGKRGQDRFLRDTLPRSMSFIHKELKQNRVVVIACKTGKDASVGVALAAIGKFFDADGQMIMDAAASPATKKDIQTRLQWIIASRPEANPSRTTLKRVNDFLMAPLSYRK